MNYRPEYQHGWGSKTYYTQLRLDPLPAASADEFLQALLGCDGVPHAAPLQALKQLLIERTGGNPFFLEESVRTLVRPGSWQEHRVLIISSSPSTACKSLPRCRRCWQPVSTGSQLRRSDSCRLLQ